MSEPDKAATNMPGGSGSSGISGVDADTDSRILVQNISTLKIPPFWNNRPDLWFLQVETQFRVKGITASNTKYDHLVASLPSETMEIVADILLNPPASDKYINLKNALLTRSQDSEERRLDALLHKVELGEHKPSELYRQMESLANTNSLINNSLLRKLWLNKLPASLQACIIAIEDKHDLDEIFKIADRIFDSTSSAKISAIHQPRHENRNLESLSKVVHQLSERIRNIETRQPRNRSRQFSNTFKSRRSNSKSKSQSPSTRNMCWYHKRYKSQAKKCTPPCNFSKMEPKNAQ